MEMILRLVEKRVRTFYSHCFSGSCRYCQNQIPICSLFFLEIPTKNFFLIFIYLWLCWVFVSVRGLSPVVASGGHSSSRCAGLSLSRPLFLRSTGSRCAGSVTVAHGPSCSAACGIFPDQGSNPCPPHWQADSQPLRHQGSPVLFFIFHLFIFCGGDSVVSPADNSTFYVLLALKGWRIMILGCWE